MKQNDIPVKYLQNHKTGIQALKLTEEPYAGIIYTYGKVSFQERDDGKMACNFEYSIIDEAGKVFDMAEFEQYISGILDKLIQQGIEENSLVYTGGVDENRTEDSNESDSR